MSKPLTMTEEKEREYRACCTSGGTEVDPVFAELDATRAALAAAEAKLADERKHADRLADHMQSLADNGYEFNHPRNTGLVDDLLAAHAARRQDEAR